MTDKTVLQPQSYPGHNCQSCTVCLEDKPLHLGSHKKLSCCSRAGCRQIEKWFCDECYFDKLESFQLNQGPPHFREEFHVWLYHNIICHHCRWCDLDIHTCPGNREGHVWYVFKFIAASCVRMPVTWRLAADLDLITLPSNAEENDSLC